ncbi:MAG: hypothetical protein ACI9WU_000013 [Myxococcota bacterium]
MVERFFVLLRRRGLMLSPTDVARVQAWHAGGIPVDVVCRGLLAGAEIYRERHGAEAPLPASLGWYAAFVQEAVEAHLAEPPEAAMVSAEPISADGVGDALADLAWIGQRESDPRRREAYRAAWRALSSSEDDRQTALERADSAAVDAMLGQLDEDVRLGLTTEVENRIRPEAPQLGRRGLVVRRRAILEDLVVAQYGLVRVSGERSEVADRGPGGENKR